ncbi:MAG: ImuA protein [Hyphomicrobiaceae bacterium]|nr:ImuA protein [Hyphomicrobiaceae bacterium]
MLGPSLSPLVHRQLAKAARIEALRRDLARLEGAHKGSSAYLRLGPDEVHAHLPGPGLPCGTLNEIVAEGYGHTPAAFGFALAMLALALHSRPGPAVFVLQTRCRMDFGAPYGHGLVQLGLDPGRLVIVETRSNKDALWALEEALRSPVHLAMVAGAVASGLDLTMSRRLNLAAAPRARPLVLLRGSVPLGTSAAATRWRIGSAPAARDPFATFARPRWTATLERCRNGRTGKWLIEWDHVTHRLCVVEGMADRAPVERAGIRRIG